MNLRPSDSELRLQVQQFNVASRSRAPSPFAAALGIGIVVLGIWLLFVLGPVIPRFIALVHEGADLALVPFRSSSSAP